MKTKIIVKFVNTYCQIPDCELCNVETEKDDDTAMLAISDIYNCGYTMFSYFPTARDILNGNLNICNYKFINIADKSINTGNFEKEIKSILHFLKGKVLKCKNPELIVFTDGSSEEIKMVIMYMCMWLKYLSQELPITVDGKDPNLDKEKLHESFCEYTEEEFCKRINEII